LIISFSSRALRNLAESATLATNRFGPRVAVALHAHLADLAAARNVAELPIPPNFSTQIRSRFSLRLADGFVVVFESNHAREREDTGKAPTEWHKVNRAKLVEVVKEDE
jgi:hypothetical protein